MSASFLSELRRRNVLRVAAAYAAASWLLIQVAETVLPLYGFDESVARIVVNVLVVGLVPVIGLTWVFEWTPDGIRKDSDIDHAAATRTDTRRFDRFVLVAMALAIGYFAVDKFVFDPARDAAREQAAKEEGKAEAIVGSFGDKSIAVLPFVNMSSDPTQEYFSDGIAEEILNLLATVRELRVISRSSSFSFKGQDIDATEIASRLNVAHVLEGSVRKSGNTVRITAQLIEARTDTHIWSHTWDRELMDVFEIQDEIAADVLDRLKISLLTPLPAQYQTDPQVHALTLQAKYAGNTSSSDGSIKAIRLLEQALAIDPDYVPALLQLSMAIYFAGRDDDPEGPALQRRAEEVWRRAKALAPNDPLVVAYRAWDLFEVDKDLERAADQFELAVSLGPGNSELLRMAGVFARHIGKFDPAIVLLERSVSLDPACVLCIYLLANSYYRALRIDEAIKWQQNFMQLTERGGGFSLGRMYLLGGDPESALAAFESDRVAADGADPGRAMALHDLGRIDESRATLQRFTEAHAEESPRQVALVHAWFGDVDAAMEWLLKEFSPDAGRFFTIAHDPIWRNLWDDPRWQELAADVALSEDRVAAIDFNPELPQ